LTDDPMAILRGVVATFERRVAAGNEDPASVAQTVKWVVAVLRAHGRRPRTSKKPPRGVGYGQMGKDGYTTPDDAMIVASLPWFDSMAAAIRHQFPKASPEEVRNHADRIRERMAAIESIDGVSSWETSETWLTDLIPE
jgi:hypothetical protein